MSGSPVVSHRTIAEAYAIGLDAGLVTAAEIGAWADQIILAEAKPAFAFIEVSAAGQDEDALVAALRSVPGVADGDGRRNLVFAMMRRSLAREPAMGRRIARMLELMALAEDVPNPGAGSQMSWFDDAFDLADRRIWGTHESVLDELRRFLEEHGNA